MEQTESHHDHRRFRALDCLTAAEAETFLREALRFAHASELPMLTRLVVRKGSAGAQRSLFARYRTDRAVVEPALQSAPGSLAPLAEEMLGESDASDDRRALLAVLSRREDLPAMEVVASAMRAERGGGDLARTLLRGGLQVVGRRGTRRLEPEDREVLDGMLIQLARQWDEGSREASGASALTLLLAIALERAGAALREVLEDDALPATLAVRGIGRLVDEPLVARSIIRWMGTDSRGRGAVRRLSDHLLQGDSRLLLEDGHLLRTGRRRPLLRRVDRPAKVVDRVLGRAGNLDVRARLALPALIAGMGLSSAARVARLGMLRNDPSPVVRLRAVEAAALLGGTLPEAWNVPSGDPAALSRPPRSDLTLLDRVAAALRGGDPRQALTVIADVRRRAAVPLVEPLLLQAASAADPRIASAALSALPEGRLPQRSERILEAMEHADPRVAANAVEAAGRMGQLEWAVSRLRDAPHNRVRANALRAMIGHQLPGATVELKRMLDDPHPLHRISAIWVARVERVDEVRDVLESLERHEPLEAVRVRASAATRFLRSQPPGGRPRRRIVRRTRSEGVTR